MVRVQLYRKVGEDWRLYRVFEAHPDQVAEVKKEVSLFLVASVGISLLEDLQVVTVDGALVYCLRGVSNYVEGWLAGTFKDSTCEPPGTRKVSQIKTEQGEGSPASGGLV